MRFPKMTPSFFYAADKPQYGPPDHISADITEQELEKLKHSSPYELSDEDLVHLIQHGERRHFDLLVERYQDRIYNTSLRMLSDQDDALDAAQEVFIKAYKGIDRFRFRSTFYTWLFQITLNYCRSKLRSRSRSSRLKMLPLDIRNEDGDSQALSIPDEEPLPQERLARKELVEAAEETLQKLRPEFREVIILRDIEGLNYDQISVVLECSMGTVKSRLHRARNALGASLKRYLE